VIAALARFADALRAAGVAASPAELLDAARALDALGVEDRRHFRAALRATLAKDRKQVRAFDRAFDAFFATPARGPGQGQEGRRGGGAGLARGARSVPSEGTARRPAERARPDPKRGRSTEEPRQRRRSEERPSHEQRLEKLRRNEAAPRGRVQIVRDPRVRRDDRAQKPAAAGPRDARTVALRDLSAKDEAALAREIPKILQEIRLKTARRYGRARRGRLWPARVFRANVTSGGVPFVLPYRSRRVRRPRVVLLVDVSWSTSRAAAFFLWLASELLRSGRDTRVLAFVDRVADATRAVARWSRPGSARPAAEAEHARRGVGRKPRPGSAVVRGGRSFGDLLEGIRDLDLDAASDYGRAFHGVLAHGVVTGGRDTILVVLGDGRSNRFDPLPWTLAEIRRRCRAVVWLVPEPAVLWGTGDSRLPEYLACVDVLVEADDLAGIARGVVEIVRRT